MHTNLLSAPSADLQFLHDGLLPAFGAIRDAERLDPVSQFVRSFLGSRTYDRTSWNAFLRLSRHYRSWDAVADAPVEEIEAIIADVSFREKKAPDLKLALRKIRARSGDIHLDFLGEMPVEQALFWLEQIHGVGRKIAAATLNFSTLRRPSFVVDTHVLRVLRRFGFVRPQAGAEDAYDAVMAAADGLDADDLYELHWHLKGLGQKMCMHHQARCEACPLSGPCMKRVEEPALARHA
jgi:endonuclease-3